MSKIRLAVVVAVLPVVGLVSGPVLAAKPTPAQKCAVAKIGAAAKKTQALLKCWTKVVTGGALDPLCVQKAETKFASVFAKAEAKGGCATVADAGDVELAVDTCVGSLVVPIAEPTLSADITAKSGPPNARVWSVTVSNGGVTNALAASLDGVTLVQASGAACTPVVTAPSLPHPLGDIAPSASTTTPVTIDFTGCPGDATFDVTLIVSSNGGAVNGTAKITATTP